MSKKMQIKLSVTPEMYQALKERANLLSLSVPALCCYFIGEKLYQTNFSESIVTDGLQDIINKFIDEEKKE